ncbi:MAG: glycerate kinase [Thermoleophilaceae bacterium]
MRAQASGGGPVLVAPDAFKGTLSASEVAAAIASGLRAAGHEALELPAADGGEGTLEVLAGALGGRLRDATVADPLGRPVKARWALLPDGETAVLEMAEASGLWRLAEDELDPWSASTRGTGELIAAAAREGASKIVLGAGGSATVDGGAGALEALADTGVSPRIEVVCDVRAPWEAAPALFGPQKGADAAMIPRLERRLAELARTAPNDPTGEPMTGAAGGLAGGLWAHRGAKLVPGAAYVLDTIGFDEHMRAAPFVVTGEGWLDSQTLAGKLAGEVATRCRQSGVACHAIAGRNGLDPFAVRVLDLASVHEAGTTEEIEAAARTLASG